MDMAALISAIEILAATTKAWPAVRLQFETQQYELATDLANLLLIQQFDPMSLVGLQDDQGKLLASTSVPTDVFFAALRLMVTPTLTSQDWSRAILRSVAPGSLVFRYLVSSVRDSSKDSGRINERDLSPGPEDPQGDQDVSLPLGLLFNLMDAAEDGGQALLETGKSGAL